MTIAADPFAHLLSPPEDFSLGFNLQEQAQQPQESSWTGKDYAALFQGIGHLAESGGNTFQKIFLATKANDVKATITQNTNNEVINKLINENRSLQATINQTGAVPQVYAPQTQIPQQQQQNNIKPSHVVFGVLGAVVIVVGGALMVSR
ncbi:hypothetical protein [Candidatus Uabimicrobium sp. HlEnr_7]|uniref:hypothetical protein n=1 Tax=Candidatus Uabimicrobium helgolandensis TaxID=3095367 RepID=UPI0035570454